MQLNLMLKTVKNKRDTSNVQISPILDIFTQNCANHLRVWMQEFVLSKVSKPWENQLDIQNVHIVYIYTIIIYKIIVCKVELKRNA